MTRNPNSNFAKSGSDPQPLTIFERPNSRQVESGRFSLIELLVVISILAILMAMLLPVLAQTREQGRRASCLSNTRQQVTVATIWSGDHDRLLPPDGRNSTATDDWTNRSETAGMPFHASLLRAHLFEDFGLDEELYNCPTARNYHIDTAAGHGQNGVDDPWTSYFYLGNGQRTAADWETDWESRPQRLTDDNASEKTLWSCAVAIMPAATTWGANPLRINHPSSGNSSTADAAPQAFLDGHGRVKRDFPTALSVGAGTNANASHTANTSEWNHYWW